MSSRRSLALLTLALSSGVCVALEVARVVHSGTNLYSFLVWNLLLAWIPFALALAIYDGHRRGRLRLGLGALWLLFLPNAPYIVTDLVHLRHIHTGAPAWFDLILVSSFAWTGLALGFGSLLLTQTVMRARFGARHSWEFAVGALTLASFGVYLGRFLRLNSWDFFLQPSVLLRLTVASPVKAAAVTLALTAFLTLAYVMLHGLARLRAELERVD
jgi:uncharacterized membrane protein